MSISDFKFWSWDKKPRTMLRFVKPGDIFCFELNEHKYCFGRVISKILTGHIVEIFDFTLSSPDVTESDINKAKRIFLPVVIDTYGLFDRKGYPDSDWRIIGHHNNYHPEDIDNVYFTYGVGNACKKVNVFDEEESISEREAELYPRLSPHSDYHIKQLLKDIL